MISLSLLAVALADTPVTELKDDYRPTQIVYHRGDLSLDGVQIIGSRADKRQYLETIVPLCEVAAPIEERRARRVRSGNRLGMGGLAVVLGASVFAPSLTPAVGLALVLSGGGLALGGGALSLSGASMQRSIAAYNACATSSESGDLAPETTTPENANPENLTPEADASAPGTTTPENANPENATPTPGGAGPVPERP